MSEFDLNVKRGQIWRAILEPTEGREINKDNRPVLVLGRPSVGEPSVNLCVPITDFKPGRDGRRYWRVFLDSNEISGLEKPSCADVSQTRALDTSRFLSQDGRAQAVEVEAVAAALAKSVGYTAPAPTETPTQPEAKE